MKKGKTKGRSSAKMKQTRRKSSADGISQLRLGISDALAIQELTSMRELVLQSEVIEPLLRRMGFRNVQDTSGPSELGKDLIATKPDEFGQTMLYAIQIKKFKPSAKVGTADSFGRLLDQLRQSIEEVVIDPTTNEKRSPDWCLFITPYPIPMHVKRAFHQRLKDPVFRVLRFIDGPMLIEQIQTHMPEALTRFSMETQYRLHIAQQVGMIRESAVAFELNEELKLDNIYVDAWLSQDDPVLTQVAVKPFRSEGPLTAPVLRKGFEELYSHYKRWARYSPNLMLKEEELLRTKGKIDEIDLDLFFKPIRERVCSYLRQLTELSDPKTSPEQCTKIATEGIHIKQDLRLLQKVKLIKKHWDSLTGGRLRSKQDNIPGLIASSSLIKIRECLLVLGAPGFGKTTLLRRLSQAIARSQRTQLPIFLPLISVDEMSYEGLVNACLKELEKEGFRVGKKLLDKSSFLNLLNSGKFRLCLDGLDEAGSKAWDLMKVIDQFVVKHKRCKVLLSSRDTFGLTDWDRAVTFHLAPFSDEQLEAFISKWFLSDLNAIGGLLSWLTENERMREAARTPLIAALLCSLFQIQADMPSTEIELYERRFELLLGRWDQAKRIPPLRSDIRKRYLHFLMALAFHLHQEEKRSATNEEAIKFAKKYYIEQFHRTPDAMVLDCIIRGLLEREESGSLSFGHLTYQEYLTAEWLAQHNPTAFVWSRILTPWWKKTLEFYSARKLDITPLVRVGLKYRGEGESMERICELVKFAPLTSEEVVIKFRRLLRTEDRTSFNWGASPPKLSTI